MEFLWEIGLFLVKAVIIVGGILAVVAGVAATGGKGKGEARGHIKVRELSKEYRETQKALEGELLDSDALKKKHKEEKKAEKARKKAQKKQPDDEESLKPRVFVLDFHGDIRASAVSRLREEITAVLGQARQQDEVLVRLESAGGMVHSYGLASSQLQRIRDKGIPLTIAVDKVAASGGYMMACLADKLVAAPFAIIGSVGVMAQLPNIHRLLKKHDIDVELHTAGEFKRTLTVMGENTEKGRQKFIEDLERTHELFKDFVVRARPVVDVEQISTGEIWYGSEAMAKKLVDELKTSDAYLCECFERDQKVFLVNWAEKKSLPQKLGVSAEQAAGGAMNAVWEKLQSARFPS
ncbi:protease SohB [Parendozoicomonas haliclonae]|uniref:Putative protease SohB n=1 Tax=Parendozoicomonas haliclonae TaxID=1960125 RepID=A0A1X7ALW7_9GAMM|nr:protease SohB [Parendozoicomonas haliclonae]SMA49127.1 putative protease SohB [Parendozoicomonas haliclonae]